MITNNQIDRLKERHQKNGYIIVPSVFSKKLCRDLKKRLRRKQVKATIPFSKSPYGYGNLLNDKDFKKLANNEKLNKLVSELLGSENFCYSGLYVNNKDKFIGPGIEWHQEIMNINTFAPGNSKKDWRKFIQIYIAIDNQNSNIGNGALNFIPKSYKLGFLKPKNTLDHFFRHKRKVDEKTLEKAIGKYGLLKPTLKSGDVLLFNHLIVHGSSTNITPHERMSVVLQGKHKNIKFNDKIFKKESDFRKKFASNFLKNTAFKISDNKSLYRDFNKR